MKTNLFISLKNVLKTKMIYSFSSIVFFLYKSNNEGEKKP